MLRHQNITIKNSSATTSYANRTYIQARLAVVGFIIFAILGSIAGGSLVHDWYQSQWFEKAFERSLARSAAASKEDELMTIAHIEPSAKPQVDVVPKHSRERAFIKALINDYGGDETSSEKILEGVLAASKETGLSPGLILAVAAKNSGFNMTSSSSNLVGLLRVNPNTHPQEKFRLDMLGLSMDSIEGSLMYGALVLKSYIDANRGIVDLALQRFNVSDKESNKGYVTKIHMLQERFNGLLSCAV